MNLRALVKGLAASGPGRAGLACFGALALLSAYVLFTYPADFGPAHWGNPALWADHPRSAPPAWTNLFSRQPRPVHVALESDAPAERASAGAFETLRFELPFRHIAAEPPTFLSVSLKEIVYHQRPPIVDIFLIRPDGEELLLYRQVIAGPRPGEAPPYERHVSSPLRVVLSSEARAISAVQDLYERAYGMTLSTGEIRGRLESYLFGKPAEDAGGGVEILQGAYRAEARVTVSDPRDSVGGVRFVAGGAVFGWMGTDALGRDLAAGLLFGLPVALVIGLAASTVSTAIGAALGLISGYLGGRVDTLIQRAADIVANVPVLPLLIFLVFIGGTRLWLILLALVAFSWPGLTIMVRSMVLQIRSGQGVEAAQAMGASHARVIFRHIFPHLGSYIFAQLVFFAPSAILAEAGLSFLGLGDPSIPTWGQILEHGFRTGAVFLGYWWWVIPPGLLIVVTAVTFMLLALGMEQVVDPRLRGVRLWRSSK